MLPFVRMDPMMTIVAALWLAVSSIASIKQEPPAKAREAKCTHWRGTVRGNDPSVAVTATLCDAGDSRVRGTLVWESRTSGSSTRTLEGARSGDTLTLKDVALTGKPNPGWRFCTVDRYTLAGAGTDRLSGTYHSGACSDDATIDLERVR